MNELILFDALQEGLWIAVVVSMPILASALVVGLVIGLIQALTSVQEMTLTFVPKMAAILAAFWFSMGFMTLSLTSYFQGMLLPLIIGG